MPGPDPDLLARLERVADEQDIREVLARYCRGIDRRDMELVRTCYHPDAVDDHGSFVGGVDDFIAFVEGGLDAYESTMHFLGTMRVAVDGDRARSESYLIAFHRLGPKPGREARDHIVGLRYIDDMDKRDGEWRIASRVCAFDWTRTDPVPPGWDFSEGYRRGRRDGSDPVFAPSIAALVGGAT